MDNVDRSSGKSYNSRVASDNQQIGNDFLSKMTQHQNSFSWLLTKFCGFDLYMYMCIDLFDKIQWNPWLFGIWKFDQNNFMQWKQSKRNQTIVLSDLLAKITQHAIYINSVYSLHPECTSIIDFLIHVYSCPSSTYYSILFFVEWH